MERIVVTGTGIVTSLGMGKSVTLKMLLSGQRAIGTLQHLHTKHTDIPAGEVPYDDGELRDFLGIPANKKITRTSLLGRVALKEALAEAHLQTASDKRVAFINGNTVGGMEKSERFYHHFLNDNERNDYIALHDCGACTDLIAEEYGGKFELITTISTACSSAANAIILGANLIREGKADIAVVGGTECLSLFHLNGFNSLMILDNDPCRPFDAERHGLNLGEGAAYIVIEGESTAARRGIAPLCQLSGYGNACDAFHQTATSPNGEGAYRAMRQALASSGLTPDDIDYINAHGTGTDNNDLCEGIAMMRIFGDQMPPVSSTKSYTGHTTSAAGGVESVISILALQHQFIPANIGFKTPIAEHNFRPVDHVVKDAALQHVLTNSFGFGGNDSSCIFSTLDAAKQASNAIQSDMASHASTGEAYIRAISQISVQQPLSDEWFEHPIMPAQPYNESIEPDYKPYFSPIAARRMGKLLKRAVATAVSALQKAGMPTDGTALLDAVITGTGLGCIDSTEKFLTAMLDNDEECLPPTHFMQSTHNTIGSQVALHLKCHGYNCTYSHRGTSFDSSLFDALSQIRLGLIHNALVGGQDEMTPAYFDMLGKIGYWRTGDVSPDTLRKADNPGSLSGSCSLNMFVTDVPDRESLCRIDGMDLLNKPTPDELREHVRQLIANAGLTPDDVPYLMLGLSGDKENDAVYRAFSADIMPQKNILWYKHIFGESFCSSAFGVYAAALCLHRSTVPMHLFYGKNYSKALPKHILVYNHFHNIDHSLLLLSQC
ncbi:MAG: beta-ketoacyl-[acyl-carrier-protein] synthase family protein [Bacteroidales bacterium]|nr:beta-ketoacyl-[acyl-carrier-protein] synthase family protein [Bacteroidales bacterium]